MVSRDQASFRFQAGPETLRVTNLGELQPGQRVNLERALAVGQRLGGHIVQGHVDAIGRIVRRQRDGDWEFVWFECPGELGCQLGDLRGRLWMSRWVVVIAQIELE